MTAPAPALLPRTAALDRPRDAAPAPAANGPRASETPGFAAHLARETPSADETPSDPQTPPATPSSKPDAAPVATNAPDAAADTGKVLPPVRQTLAAAPAVFLALAATQSVNDAGTEHDETAAPAATPADGEPEAAIALVALPLPSGSPLPLPAPTAAAARTGAPIPPATIATPTPGPATPRAPEPPAPAAQTAHPAAFAVAALVLEREAAAEPPAPPAPAEAVAPDTATQAAARAQPSTLAALTGAPTLERAAPRKLRAEADLSLPSAKLAALPVPETAGALAQAQQPLAPATASPASAAPAPQPISFDQLVDSIARARDGLEPAGPVAVAMHHAEFGRISLRIEGDTTGLSVAMASPDPAFAPAVAAAHAAATSEPARMASAPETPGQSPTQSQSQGQNQPGTGQQRHGAAAPASQRPAANPARPSAPADERRGGIFA
jgi:Meckel syndrome type 1 protein